MSARTLMVFAALLSGCPGPSGTDGGDAPDAGVSTILDGCMNPPAPPEAPRLTDWTCPAGWEQVDAHAVSEDDAPAIKVCAPPALPASCPTGQRASLGSSACQSVGDACPAGDYAPAPTGTVLYVKAGAVGGNGSLSTPYGSIAIAVSMAPAGATVLIAKGSYTEYVPMIRPVTLLGACAEQTTVIAPTRDATRGTLDVGAAVTIKNLTVTGPRPGIWISFNTTFAVLDGVIVKNAELVGVFVSDNGRAQLDDVLITDTRVDPADNTMGRGLQIRSGGQAKGTGITIEKSRDLGITLDGTGCSATLDDLIVRDTQSETASRAYGQGMEVRYGARATLTRALFEKNHNAAVVSDQAGSTLKLTDTVLQDTLPQENNNQYGSGLELATGVTADLTRVLVRRNRAAAIRAGGATLTAADLAVTDTEGRANDNTQGLGLVMDLQAQVSVSRGVFANNRIADFLVSDKGSRLTLTDVRTRGTRVQASDNKWGIGFIAMAEAALDATRFAIEHTDEGGGQVQSRAVATLNDLSIRNTGEGPTKTYGDGLALLSSSQITITRAEISKTRRLAVGAFDKAVVQLNDVRITDVAADPTGYFGRAVGTQGSAIVSLTRVEIARARESALYSNGSFTRLYVDQVSVVDTQPNTVSMGQEGRAASIEGGSSATLNCFLARGNNEVAVNANGADTHLTVTRARLLETKGPEGFGDGLAASVGATVEVDGSEVEANQNVGLAFANAQGVIKRTLIRTNSIGVYVGEGATSREVEQAGAIVPREVQIESTCTFDQNQTHFQGDFVPVPGTVVTSVEKPPF